jgi:arylsulfatase A-like enzyme
MRVTSWALAALVGALGAVGGAGRAQEAPRRPNIVFIMADDLGFGELGVYGQTRIRTPRLDRLAAEGMRFTQYYSGAPVCAPARSVLMTGQHAGHTRVRGNADPARQSLRPEDVTVAEVLKQAGYATGITGKWGLGDTLPGGGPGLPNRQGFDFAFGYHNQKHAHNYYPPFLFRNEEPVKLPNSGDFDQTGAGTAREKRIYSPDLILDESLRFIDRNRERPFFLYLSWTLPHANNEANRDHGNGAEVPELGEYADRPWPAQAKGHAAMVTYLDTQVGKVLDRLDRAGLAKDTLILFTSDNGPHREAGHDPALFEASGPFRGIKRALTEGGIRVPFIARWPGRIQAGAVSDHVAYHGDLMATVAELTGAKPPAGLDSISYLPTLLGRAQEQRRHDYLYWEFYEQGSRQAIRAGNWKAIRQPMFTGPIELYDLAADPGERNNLAAARPEVVAEMERRFKEAHVPSPDWKVGR